MEDQRSVVRERISKRGQGTSNLIFFNKANNFALKMFRKQKHCSVFLQMKALKF